MIKDKKTIIQTLATKYKLPLKEIAKMTEYQFKFVSKIMKEGNFESIRLPYFGKISVNKKRVEYINKLKNGNTK